mmetsp:Transcript_7015/g.19104  ORF Transcript_7015/g.19104 Transcript_7015/m.19104 type:complete len:1431 (-) Transcript_7015:144-4436(-)
MPRRVKYKHMTSVVGTIILALWCLRLTSPRRIDLAVDLSQTHQAADSTRAMSQAPSRKHLQVSTSLDIAERLLRCDAVRQGSFTALNTSAHPGPSHDHQDPCEDVSWHRHPSLLALRCYAQSYKDVRDAYGFDPLALRKHWLQYGIREGRTLCINDPVAAAHADIVHRGEGKERNCRWLSYGADASLGRRHGTVIAYIVRLRDSDDPQVVRENIRFFTHRGLDHVGVNTSVWVITPRSLLALSEPLTQACRSRPVCSIYEYNSTLRTEHEVLQNLVASEQFFDNLVLVTSLVRGPFLPTWLPAESWDSALCSMLRDSGDTDDGEDTWMLVSQLDLTQSFPGIDLSKAVVAMKARLVNRMLELGFGLLERHGLSLALSAGKRVTCLQSGCGSVDLLKWYNMAVNLASHNLGAFALGDHVGLFEDNPISLMFYASHRGDNKAVSLYSSWMLTAGLHTAHDTRENVQMDARPKVLVVYAFYESGREQRKNMLYFLRHGMDSYADTTIVVNGNTTIHFPHRPQLRVIFRENTCFDFGAWGFGLEAAVATGKTYAYYILMNSSVRGPFFPFYVSEELRGHWTQLWISRLRWQEHLVGLAINCPDGLGGKAPHVMSMAILLDEPAMAIARNNSMFSCAASYREAMAREAQLSEVILSHGLNVGSMQWSYVGVDWRASLKTIREAPLVPNSDRFPACQGIALDIFYGQGWYFGITAHPHETMFFKTNRHILPEAHLDSYEVSSETGIANLRKVVVLMSHSWDGDGAPRYLLEVGKLFGQQGLEVIAVSPSDGSLRNEFEHAGIKTAVYTESMKCIDLQTLLALLERPPLELDPARISAVVLNTVLWAPIVAKHRPYLLNLPSVVWILHENQLTREQATQDGFWYGLQFPSLMPKVLLRTTLGATYNVFVADKQRAQWSHNDHGNFLTIRGAPSYTAGDGVNERNASAARMRSKLGISSSPSSFVMTMLGTVCQRKRQLWGLSALRALLDRGVDAWLVVIGMPSITGGNGDSVYASHFKAQAQHFASRVKMLPFSPHAKVREFLLMADLHLSASYSEAFPLNTLDAMALGIPVVATAAGGTEEQFFGVRTPEWMTVRNLTSEAAFVKAVRRSWLGHKHGRLRSIGAAMYEDVAVRSRTMFERHVLRLSRVLSEETRPRVCFVVRTYAPQLHAYVFNLRQCLRSLLRQDLPFWEALIVQTDSQAMTGIFKLLAEIDDPRIRFVRPANVPERSVGGFEVTDDAISQCSRSSRWLVVTNGDNIYEPQFLSHLLSDEHTASDVVAFDFYSRSVHILDHMLGVGCERFFAHPHAACKGNHLRPWHTDLGANAVNRRRWLCEELRYDAVDGGPSQEQDGLLMSSVVYWDWTTSRVRADRTHGCLFHHSPNIAACIRYGGPRAMWDESKQACVSQNGMQPRPYKTNDPPLGTGAYNGRCFDRKLS